MELFESNVEDKRLAETITTKDKVGIAMLAREDVIKIIKKRNEIDYKKKVNFIRSVP